MVAADRAAASGTPERNGSIAWLIEVDSQTVLGLAGLPEITVGRSDTRKGIFPDIDLTSFDPYRFVSRRHASILCEEDGRFRVIDRFGTLNGTFVNGLRLPVGMPAPLRFGDLVVFGLTGFRFESSPGAGAAQIDGSQQAAEAGDPASREESSEARAQGSSFAFGLNENVEVEDRLFHAQTEDLGWEHQRVLTVVYEAGSIVFSRKTPYSFFWDRHGREFLPAQMVRFQHRGITKGLRLGKLLGDETAVHNPRSQ